VKRFVASTLALAMTASLPARAQEASRCDGRVHTITTVLDSDARHARVWYWAWMVAGTALVGGQAALAAVTTGDLQKELVVGAAASVFIPGLLLLHPPAALSDGPLLDARLAETTVDGHLGDPCVMLPRAREILLHTADDEAFATGWFAHAFVIGGNIALGLLLGLGFHDWAGGAKQTLGGVAIAEFQILTVPTGALSARGLGLAGTF
jgi:hypothetical protein